jgi:hypothetical protein
MEKGAIVVCKVLKLERRQVHVVGFKHFPELFGLVFDDVWKLCLQLRAILCAASSVLFECLPSWWACAAMRFSTADIFLFGFFTFCCVPRSHVLFPLVGILVDSNCFLCHDPSCDRFCNHKFLNLLCSYVIVVCKAVLNVLKCGGEFHRCCVRSPCACAFAVVIQAVSGNPFVHDVLFRCRCGLRLVCWAWRCRVAVGCCGL